MLVITHAFSRKNAGDGLLVDLTLQLLAEAGVGADDCRILALDADSFADLRHVHLVPGEPRARPSPALVGATVEVVKSAVHEVLPVRSGGVIEQLMDGASGIVAVGGGYLVADSVVRSGGVLLNHLPQILAAGRARVPSIYLPQSIGPLRGPVGMLTRRALSRVDVIYARDDETMAELAGVTDVRRCPDLAVLELASSLSSIAIPTGGTAGPTVVVGRDLPRAPGYHARLLSLGRRVPRPLWAVQADVDGPRSDRRFVQHLGVDDAGNLKDVLGRHQPGVVVSVRLHGAIASLLAGWPAIHLSYERKGWGAYEDLGLKEWVHDARSFDVDLVNRQIAELHDHPGRIFDAIQERLPQLQRARSSLVAQLQRSFSA